MKIVSPPPRLVFCATLWSLVGHPGRGREWSLGRKLRAIRDAGFDAVAETFRPGLAPHLRRLGLRICGRVVTRDGRDAPALLAAEVAGGARLINVLLGAHDTPPAAAVAMFLRLERTARRLGAEVYLETHRDTCTETPEKIAALARLYRRQTGTLLPLTWDHSHPCVVKHVLPEDFARRLLDQPRLIQRSHLFHCRPFGSQHCQVPVTNGRGRLTPEFKDYLGFAEELFAVWLAGPAPRGELWVCPEMGTTVGYHVSTNPAVWPDTVRGREELQGAWDRALGRLGLKTP